MPIRFEYSDDDEINEIIFNAGLIAQNLLDMFHREEDFQSLMEEWYKFEEITSRIVEFFEFGFDDEDFQDFWLSKFMEENGAELSAIRDMIEDEEDNKTIVFDHVEIIHG